MFKEGCFNSTGDMMVRQHLSFTIFPSPLFFYKERAFPEEDLLWSLWVRKARGLLVCGRSLCIFD